VPDAYAGGHDNILGAYKNDELAATKPGARQWQRDYTRRLVVLDLLVIVAAISGSQLIWLGSSIDTLHIPVSGMTDFTVGYWLVSALIAALWMASLAISLTRAPDFVGTGMGEYGRVITATAQIFGLIAVAMFLLKSELGRGYFLTAVPVGLALLITGRWAMRQWLTRRRARGEFLTRVILVGDRAKTEHVVQSLRRDASSGLDLVGALLAGSSSEAPLHGGVPVLGDLSLIVSEVQARRADAVIFTGTDELGPREMRELGWKLDELRVSVIVAPALTDIAGPRIHAAPVAGQPLIRVDYPSLEGLNQFAKRAFDIAGSLALIFVLSPVMLAVAFAVKMTSPGPVLYRQERIGHQGRPFFMLKFRSMVVDADDRLGDLLRQQGTGSQPLFKITDDPRVTGVGRILRKYSLDELPQLFNVLRGSMSLVGPRPQRAAEVELYDSWAHRRLLVTPGVTGLWQVSGRSDLSWEDSVRLDLYYVENWSLASDIIILWRTVRAVVAPAGAY
jgi:exopolysaccharide biosynthesis polyprenyl glycosylphosphotransferase